MQVVLRHGRLTFEPFAPARPLQAWHSVGASLRYVFSTVRLHTSTLPSACDSKRCQISPICSPLPKPLHRLFTTIDMADDEGVPVDHQEPIRLRSYQQEMLDESLKRNIIVAMDTGSGKTHVAIFRIQAELERSPPDKLVWFTTPSVALSMQQHAVLASNLPAYQVKMLTGDNGVDAWTDQSIWNAVLANVRVVVGTPKVLEDALSHGFVTISRLALLVFDEAHRCIGNSPMNTIMRVYYHPAQARGHPVPHILGLTASPIISARSSTLKELETDLNATAITPKLHRSELEAYVHPPTLTIRPYSSLANGMSNPTSPLHHGLETAFTSYSLSTDPYVLELIGRGDAKSQMKLCDLQQKPNTFCYSQFKTLRNRANAMSEQLGSSATEWYIEYCIKRFLDHSQPMSGDAQDITSKERIHLRGILESIINDSDMHIALGGPLSISEKLQSLFDLLSEQDVTQVRGIVFVEQRATVAALTHMLRTTPAVSNGYSIGSFVGASSFSDRRTTISDIVDAKQQQQDLIKFRDGGINLMVATNVLEEGIDVSACNLVICFDPPKNLVSFVQRRGRARKSHSNFVIFLSPLDAASHPAKWQDLEHEMRQAYMEDRHVEVLAPEAVEKAERGYNVESTGAMLTLQNAKAHLYHFCAVSSNHGGRYVDVRPEFETLCPAGTSKSGCALGWTSRVTLPAFVHPSVRVAHSSRGYASEANAVKDAAFEAYKALHKAELLNDHLLPLTAQHVSELDQTHLDQPSIVDVPSRINVWEWVFNRSPGSEQWYQHELSLSLDGFTTIAVELLLPCELVQPLLFSLFWNESATYQTAIRPLNSIKELATDEHYTLQQFTHMILGAAHVRQLSQDTETNYAFLITPHEDGLVGPIERLKGSYAASVLTTMSKASRVGLIHVKSEPGRSYTLANDNPITNGMVAVKKFTQRADFLQPVVPTDAQNEAYTTVFSFALSECVVDNIPAEYAFLSAFLPSIMHRVQSAACAQLFKQDILPNVDFSDCGLLEEATTSPSCGAAFDYNRLEYLGDTILKFYTVRQVMSHRPNWPEQYLSLKKFLLVSNRTLAEAAQRLGISRFINLQHFTGRKWQPDQLGPASDQKHFDQQISSKVLADVMEALIGAGFVDGGLEKSFEVLRTLLPEEFWYSHAEPMSLLLQETPVIECPGLGSLQRLIGHDFKYPGLLLEAITHASFPNNTTTLSYERLEFLGDAVLDMILVSRLFNHPRKLKEWEMENCKKSLAFGRFLSYVCMSFSIDEDCNDVIVKDAAGGKQIDISETSRKVRLCDFLRCGEQTATVKRQTRESFEQVHATIDKALYNGQEYPWVELTTLAAPKFLGDMVEAILGAIYIDTGGDLSACEAFIGKTGVLSIVDRMLDDRVEVTYPKQRLSLMVGSQTIDYETTSTTTSRGEVRYGCVVKVGGFTVVEVGNCARKDEAEVRAAREAVVELEKVANGGRLRPVVLSRSL